MNLTHLLIPSLALGASLPSHAWDARPNFLVIQCDDLGCNNPVVHTPKNIWGMVSFLDEQLGRVLAELDHLGIAGRTVVVLMSDNGPAVEHGKLSDAERDHPEVRKELSGLLREWWGKLTAEPGAFEPPIFPLTTGGNSVPARAPSKLQGSLVNLPGGESELGIRLRSNPPPDGLPILKAIEIVIDQPAKP